MELDTCSVYENVTPDYTFIIGLYITIGIIAKYYKDYYEHINFEYDSDDEYNGVICV